MGTISLKFHLIIGNLLYIKMRIF